MIKMSKSAEKKIDPSQKAPRLVAVVDIGATSIRMAIAEITGDAKVRVLENLSQAVSLGRDSFVNGRIGQETIEDCVHALRIYREKLSEYGIESAEQIRVVATSAVREASNQLAFQDRVFIATGFEIESFDVAELHRVTYLGILPFLQQLGNGNFQNGELGRNLVCEIGGGSTEVLLLDNLDVHYSHTFRFGGLRVRRTLEALQVPLEKMRSLMKSQIQHVVGEIESALGERVPNHLIAMGSEMRWMASDILKRNLGKELAPIPLERLREFNQQYGKISPEKLALKFRMGLPDAMTLLPTLLAFELLASELKLDTILVANVNMRDGLITEMGMGKGFDASIEKQIIRSAVNVGRKYHFDESHCLHVAQLSRQLFEQLSEIHQLNRKMGSLLYIAAILHEIGLYIGSRGFHKHSMYLIRNSEFFGIGSADLLMIALIARYHRRAMPQAGHDGYGQLDREGRVAVSKLAAILRLARALNSGRNQRIREIQCRELGNRIVIRVENVADTSLEQLELNQSNSFFESVYGSRVVLENIKSAKTSIDS